jgi:hypothetical protein
MSAGVRFHEGEDGEVWVFSRCNGVVGGGMSFGRDYHARAQGVLHHEARRLPCMHSRSTMASRRLGWKRKAR